MARANLYIKTGSYTGNGVDSTNLTGVGFRPSMFFTHRTGVAAVWRTRVMPGDSTANFGTTTANAADMLQEILNDGVQLGTSSSVNSNAVKYYYLAIHGASAQNYVRNGRYVGDGNDNRNYTGGALGFTPDIVWLKGDRTDNLVLRTSSHTGDDASTPAGPANVANLIQNFQSNGFQLGTNTKVNNAADTYYFSAFKNLRGAIASGTFTGDGAASKSVNVGFKPDFVLLKNGATTDQGLMLTTEMVTDAAASNAVGNGGAVATGILSLDATGFTVGAAAAANGSTNAVYWVAFKAGNFNVPLSRTAV